MMRVIGWVLVCLLTTGCMGGKGLRLEVETQGGGTTTKKVKLRTDYQIENGFTMTRNTVTGDYEIELGSATTKDADPGMWMFMSNMLKVLSAALLPGVDLSALIPPTDSEGED